ncbi:MAG: protein kinase, partial [Fibrobacteria bacterium]|nr:protein kinase [Fibrobacteria bacterium]
MQENDLNTPQDEPLNLGNRQLNTLIPSSQVYKAGELFANKYLIGKYFGAGSLGHTYLYHDESTQKDCILKVIGQRYSDRAGFNNAFTMLAKSSRVIKSSSICQIFDSGVYDGQVFFTSEYIPNITFRIWLSEALAFDQRIIKGFSFLTQIVSAMDILHKHGHFASAKPENIFLKDGSIVLSDFWISSFIPPNEFKHNHSSSKYLPYLAPEILDDWSTMDIRSDIYTAGTFLYEILVGRNVLGDFPLPSACSKLYNTEIDQVVLRAIDPNPDNRYQTIKDFQDALQLIKQLLIPEDNEPDTEENIPVESDTAPTEELSDEEYLVQHIGEENNNDTPPLSSQTKSDENQIPEEHDDTPKADELILNRGQGETTEINLIKQRLNSSSQYLNQGKSLLSNETSQNVSFNENEVKPPTSPLASYQEVDQVESESIIPNFSPEEPDVIDIQPDFDLADQEKVQIAED